MQIQDITCAHHLLIAESSSILVTFTMPTLGVLPYPNRKLQQQHLLKNGKRH